MVLAGGGMLWVIALPQQESAFANQGPLAFKPVALPSPPTMVIPPGNDPCDAGDLYAEAITDYLAGPKQYQDAARVDASQLPALQLLIKAANCSQMHLFEKNPKQVINYDSA